MIENNAFDDCLRRMTPIFFCSFFFLHWFVMSHFFINLNYHHFEFLCFVYYFLFFARHAINQIELQFKKLKFENDKGILFYYFFFLSS